MEGVIKATFHIFDPDVMRFRHDSLVGIGIFYLTIQSVTLNRCSVVQLLKAVQQPILKCNGWSVIEYILIISEH
jgi:hypothetical protein